MNQTSHQRSAWEQCEELLTDTSSTVLLGAFFLCTCLVQSIYTFVIISAESAATSSPSQRRSIQQTSGARGITEEVFKTGVKGHLMAECRKNRDENELE